MPLFPVNKKLFTFFILKTFVNNFLFINPKNIKWLPLDAPGYNESNKPYFIVLQSLDDEIM